MSNILFHKGFRHRAQFGVLLGIWGVCFIAAAMVSAAILLLGGMPLGDTNALYSPENAPTIRLMQGVSTLFIFGLPAVLYAFICFKNGWLVLGFQKGWGWKLAGLAVLVMLAAGPLTDVLAEINKAIPLPANWRAYFDDMEKNYEGQVKMMLDIKSPSGLISSLLLMAVLPALFEELFFRGGVQGLLMRWTSSPWLAIIFTSILFSAIHLSWYGFFPRMMLGFVLGAVFYTTGNLWYSIIMHMVNNSAALLYLYFMQQQGKPVDLGHTSVFPLWAGIVSAVFISWAIYYLLKDQKPEIPKEQHAYRPNPFTNTDNINIDNT